MGRIGKLVSPISVSEAVENVKGHLGLSHVRLAKGNNGKVTTCFKTKLFPVEIYKQLYCWM